MIHQHIFASPRPGMTEAEFQRYWLEVHAVRFASKIPQIKKYKIDTRIDWSGEAKAPLWGGVAEIWLRSEQDQLASLQTPEFLEGARLDEPRWAAFWNTLVLDTDAHPLHGPDEVRDAPGVKLVVITRRREGLPRERFREGLLSALQRGRTEVPGLRRLVHCTTRDGWYSVGEPRFDAVTHLWFDDVAALERILEVPSCRGTCLPGAADLVDPRQVFTMAAREHWILGPQERP